MPRPWSYTILTVAILTTFISLASSSLNQYIPRQWQRVLSVSKQPYTAPLRGCDGPLDLIKDSYTVFLHRTYALDQHKTFLVEHGVDWDTAFDEIVSSENESHGIIYGAILDDDALAAVRADIGVDLILCDTIVVPVDEENSAREYVSVAVDDH
jgi:hypothetical protein